MINNSKLFRFQWLLEPNNNFDNLDLMELIYRSQKENPQEIRSNIR